MFTSGTGRQIPRRRNAEEQRARVHGAVARSPEECAQGEGRCGRVKLELNLGVGLVKPPLPEAVASTSACFGGLATMLVAAVLGRCWVAVVGERLKQQEKQACTIAWRRVAMPRITGIDTKVSASTSFHKRPRHNTTQATGTPSTHPTPLRISLPQHRLIHYTTRMRPKPP